MAATLPESWWTRWRNSADSNEAIPLIVRGGVLALCVLLYGLQEPPHPDRPALVVLIIIAVMASIPLPLSPLTRLRPLGEAALAAALIGSSTPIADTLLPYLVVPSLAAGLLLGAGGAVTTTAVSLLVLLTGRVVSGDLTNRAELTQVLQWVGLALATGLVGAWARAVSRRAGAASDTYVAAHRLLTRLRDIARQLPTGLDEVALAQQVLASMGERIEFDRAALYTITDAGVLVPLAFAGSDRVGWDPSLEDGIWSRAWRSGRPHQQSGMFLAPRHGHSAVLALRLGERRIGLVGLERDGGQWNHRQLVRAQDLADDAALRIDTGQLFSEVRALATVEERRRLAREIHDGVAQEIASLGYLVDDLRARAVDLEVRDELLHLREELTRVVTELRLSIFDLRTDVQPATGLGAALSSYVRSVGTGSGLTVHLVLDESAHRLPIEAETELLRIAQEAVTNARKHSRAKNLWVTCRVDPPRAFLRIADDGAGLGTPRHDSYGLEIMRERTARLGASFAVRSRVGGGTVVEVTVGASGASGTAPLGRESLPDAVVPVEEVAARRPRHAAPAPSRRLLPALRSRSDDATVTRGGTVSRGEAVPTTDPRG
jgi:signal transduction histidine kinase